jgi:phospholipase/carboxylesterase
MYEKIIQSLGISQEMKKISSLEAIEVLATKEKLGTIVLFHGYGATPHDLASLAKLSPHYHWLFPQGPIDLAWNPLFSARAWFDIDFDHIRELREQKQYDELLNGFSSELESAAQTTKELIDSIESPRLILGGFSQGAMLATHIALQNSKVADLASFSGSFVNEKKWKEFAQNRKGLSYYMSHGKEDPILPFELSERLNTFFKEHEFKGTFHPFEGMHEIPPSVIETFRAYIANPV